MSINKTVLCHRFLSVFLSFYRLIDSTKRSVANIFLILTGLMSSFWVVRSRDQASLFHITNLRVLFHQHKSFTIRCLSFIIFCLNKYSCIAFFIWVDASHFLVMHGCDANSLMNFAGPSFSPWCAGIQQIRQSFSEWPCYIYLGEYFLTLVAGSTSAPVKLKWQ